MNLSLETERKIAQGVAQYYADPLGFVMFAYPWGRPLTWDGQPNPLRDKTGPEPWQRRLLLKVGKIIRENVLRRQYGIDNLVGRFARVSGHGVGKSAVVSWLIQFFMSTRADTRGAVTANTATQLETRTWPELSKWHSLLINKHWFEWTATSYYFKKYPEDRRKNYMTTAATVSENNTVAFQGLHNEGKTIFIIFDEASGISAGLWEVIEGAMTDGEAFFFAFGNPNEASGEFFECFHKNSELYDTESIDSREVSHTNKQALTDTIKKYGMDSDTVRVRILGQFPKQAYNGFISLDLVQQAITRELVQDNGAALVMAIDVARFGKDSTVYRFRQGQDARSIPKLSVRGLDNVRVADIAMDLIQKYKPDVVCIESVGPGVGVIDILRFRGVRVVDIHPGSHSSLEGYARKRDEMYGKARDWLIKGGCLPDEAELIDQLPAFQYSLDKKSGAYILESKEDMRDRLKRGSPDEADSLALTFGVNALRRDARLHRNFAGARQTAIHDYDPLMY